MESTTERRIDPDRITGLAGTLALHVVIAGALLVGAAPYLMERTQPEQMGMEVDIIRPKPEPPPPPQVEEIRQVQPVPLPVARPRPTAPPIENTTPAPIDTYAENLAVDPVLPIGSGLTTEGEATDYGDGAAAGGSLLAYIDAPAPPYPGDALRRGLQGTVWLLVSVDEAGRPVSVAINRSSGHRVLDNAARQQVLRRWRFQPAVQGGQAVASQGLVPVAFRLD